MYYNTTNEVGQDLQENKEKALTQEQMIFNKVKLFMKRKTHKTWITSKDLRNMLQNFRTRCWPREA